ncbi:TlyA family RNA methyltransferase [Shimazuella sp. AN120528]|uniref:TlyA family RNA methyltransferase n=1 Tax=Shimazuella soli TaxID=1892854 RepID=UPI001F0D98FD|nr:TlyA family RNA methyltransferase [Shimazuella soli]MCH5584205.1 TlyA family RNA methyltransferase [Shimazuella soli]
MAKERLDILLVQKGYYPSREQAQRAIMAGLVFVDNEPSTKVGTKYPVDSSIQIKGETHPYVSRGGLKLEKALHVFSIDMNDKVVLDIGASTGGFTDCSLQNGASYVYAIDVGYGQLAWKLRTDERVKVMERTNFRHVQAEDLEGPIPNFATIDVSFISLSNIMPTLKRLLPDGSEVVALIKPQFEAQKDQVEKKGIVSDAAVHHDVLKRMMEMFFQEGYGIAGLSSSPIRGGKGNIEFLAYLIKGTDERSFSIEDQIELVLQEAHRTPMLEE